MADNGNPGNFANRPTEDVKDIASKGGQTGTENSGFASMPKEQVVCHLPENPMPMIYIDIIIARDRVPGWQGIQRLFREGEREGEGSWA